MAIQMDGPLQNPGPGLVQVGEFAATPSGVVPGPTPTQQGSQFWMNSNYSGPEPTVEVKKAFSSAEYASAWIGNYATGLAAIGINTPTVAKTAAIAPVQTTKAMTDLWKAVPEISPAGAVAVNYSPGDSITTSSPTAYNDPNHPNAPASPVSGSGAGTIDTYQPVFPIVTPSLPAELSDLADVPGISGATSAVQSATDAAKSAGYGTIIFLLLILVAGYLLLRSRKGMSA